ncbi:NAD(P)-binding domain-containing protein [Candidatus Saccharibacteria bacterium]|nr:NAD(P)-binding domain-containing protein [Candidatus Saccharibacteria bacterium]
MKIAIIGSGEVGQALAKGLVELGHKVMIGTRDTEKKELKWTKKVHHEILSVGSFAEAADFGEIAILAVTWHAAENVLNIIRPEVSGKIVIDLTNPLVFSEDGSPSLSVGHDMSAGEIVQQTLSDSHVVKTLNTINFRNMVNPKFKTAVPTMFMCGNNDSAKNHVRELLVQMGWVDIQDIGDIEKSRILEPLCLLWVEYGVANNTWNHAVSIITK